jgi:hypothetical protein
VVPVFKGATMVPPGGIIPVPGSVQAIIAKDSVNIIASALVLIAKNLKKILFIFLFLNII